MSYEKYDDAEMCFLNFETDLETEAGGTHTGMYLAWAAQRGLLGTNFEDARAVASLEQLRARQISGRDLYFTHCDGKLTDQDLSAEGNAFTAWYYRARYFEDYERVFKDQFPATGHWNDDFCSIADTWENTDRMIALLDRRFDQWRESQKPNPQGPQPSASPAAAAAAPATKAATPTVLALEPLDPLDALRERARAGDRDAWFDLGAEYITGQRVAQDLDAAAHAFTQAAELGSPDGQFNLGVCFQRGEGRSKDLQQALHWFSRAADAGHPDAIFQLALAYRSGNGVPQDLVASNALMLVAQSKGLPEAKKAGVMAGSMRESFALAEQLRKPGQLLVALERHRKTAPVPAPGPIPKASAPSPARKTAAKPATPAAKTRVPEPERPKLHAGHLALLVGAASMLILLALVTSVTGTPLQLTALVLGIIGAAGVYRCSGDLDHGPGLRLLLTALAIVPVVGSVVCIMVLLWTVRRLQEGS